MQKTNTARNNYLQAEVSTATPQKLQLLLVEAAIKNIHRTKQAWQESRFDVGIETLTVAQNIISEILCSLDMEGNPTIAKQLASIYLFIFRRLAEGAMWHDDAKLDDALRVLNAERETWRQVCDKFGSTTTQANNLSGKNSTAEFTPTSSAASKSINVTNNALGNSSSDVAGSAGYAKPQSSPISTTTFARPSGTYGIQTAAFATKPPQSDSNTTQNNSTSKKSAPSGIQINNSLASQNQNTNTKNPQPQKPIRPNPYK
ncbi:MAG: flagellar export chaperone FliS [Planctomycetaceae bacterium]|jgi:flagellar protein FliS|nr:flagellar export chaperone FliS [Planctomycetaceae bacterium]